MEYCAPRGLRHSKFLKWSKTDREKALLWTLRERSRCQGCGTPPQDWDPLRGGDHLAYVAHTVVCPGCRRRDALSNSHNSLGAEQRWGMSVQLAPNEDLPMWQMRGV